MLRYRERTETRGDERGRRREDCEDRRAKVPVAAGADGDWRDLCPPPWDTTGDRLTGSLGERDPDALAVWQGSTGRFGPLVARVDMVGCVGPDCRDHGVETGADFPPEPVPFLEADDTLADPHGRLVNAADAVDGIRSLASPAAASTTGAWFAVDRGVDRLHLGE